MKRLLLSLVPAMLATSHLASAQDTASAIRAGARVKLFVVDTLASGSGEPRYTYSTGTVVAFDGDSLVLRADSGSGVPAHGADTLRIPVTHIGSAETYTGMKRHTLEGAIIGLAVGGTVGYVVGDRDYGRSTCGSIAGIPYCANGHPHPVRDTTRMGGLAGLAGATIGYFVRTEHWSHVDVGRLRLQVGLQP